MTNEEKHRPKIVLVEDSDELRDLLRDVLRDAGYEVLAYPDADSAFAAISAERPVIVLTDIVLTDGPRGLDLITRIHSDLAPPLPKVIACSGFRDFREEAIRRGAAVFLSKPVEAADLVATIARLVEGLPPAPAPVASALQRSEDLRHRARLTAAAWLQALEEKRAHMEVNSLPAADWLVSYLGYGEAAVFLLGDQELTLVALAPSGQGPPLQVGPRLHSLLRDVVETASSLALPAAGRFLRGERSPGGRPIDLVVGAPIVNAQGGGIGAVCLFDPYPRSLDGHELAILQAMGRRFSAALGAPNRVIRPFLVRPGVVGSSEFGGLLGLELTRAQRNQLAVELAICLLSPAARLEPVLEQLLRRLPRRSCALGQLSDRVLGIYVVRERDAMAARELAEGVSVLDAQTADGVGVVSVDVHGLPVPSADELIRLAQAIASHSDATRGDGKRGGYQRLVIHGALLVTQAPAAG